MLVKVVLSLILGLFASVLILERDRDIKEAVGAYCIEMFESAMHCRMNCSIASINVLAGKIVLKDVDVLPLDDPSDRWHWTCKKYTIKISLYAMLMRKMLSMNMRLQGIAAESSLQGSRPAIMDHLKYLASFSSCTFLELNSLSLRNVHLNVHNEEHGNGAFCRFNSDSRTTLDAFKTVVYITDGGITYNHVHECSYLQGKVSCDVEYLATALVDSLNGHVQCNCVVNQLPEASRRCFVTGHYDHGNGTLQVRSADNKIIANPVTLKFEHGDMLVGGYVRLPLNYIGVIVCQKQLTDSMGTVFIRAQGTLNQGIYTAQGTCGIKDLTYKGHSIAHVVGATFVYEPDLIKGKIHIKQKDSPVFDGYYAWQPPAAKGSMVLSNSSTLKSDYVSAYEIDPQKAALKLEVTDDYKLNGKVKADVTNIKTNLHDVLDFAFNIDHEAIEVNGTFDTYCYQLKMLLNPFLSVPECILKDAAGNAIIDLHTHNENIGSYRGVLNLTNLRPVINRFFDVDTHGQGVLNIKGTTGPELLTFKAHLHDGTIQLPKTYTCITGFDVNAEISPSERSIKIGQAQARLYEGSILCNQAVVVFDENWALAFAQVPITIQQCLFNINKDLFANVSGNVNFSKHAHALPKISGVVLIDKAQLSENLFATVVYDALAHSTRNFLPLSNLNTLCDIAVMTYNPIRVTTPFMDADARVGLQLQGSIKEPLLQGSVALSSGSLKFPYKSLAITKASVVLSPGNITDPLIEIVAKNRVKKYLVTLQVSGSLQNHSIVLSSNPPLTNEQIIALLFIGSEEESLSSMIPALVMHNIKHLIFGTEQAKFLERYLSPVLTTLKHVHFVPSFTDQTRRGGLRGTLQVDINDRWRALLQKNFDLSEDARFELEYMLSDDISLKAGRDEHRDVSGEVEMRWRF